LGIHQINQAQSKTISLSENQNLEMVNVRAMPEKYKGKEALRVTQQGRAGEDRFVKISDVVMKDGVIELELSGQPAKEAGAAARGFVGVAFRISQENDRFECFYLRPTNGRAEDQLRRNHSAQYISYPDYPWHKLRQETPGMYESYVDLVPGEWTKVRIEFSGQQAKLYVHGNAQPTLIVNDLKNGADNVGSIGLWVGPGTVAHFSDLRVYRM
jgi:hypothetical protein